MARRKEDDIRQRTHDRIDDAVDKMEELNIKGREMLSLAKSKMQELRTNTDEYIANNPEKSVLIAAGVGVVVGSIVTAAIMRRRRHY